MIAAEELLPFSAMHCPYDFPPGKQELGTTGSPAEAALRRAGWGAWAVHSSTAEKNPVGNTFLCQSAASKASVRECCGGIWL